MIVLWTYGGLNQDPHYYGGAIWSWSIDTPIAIDNMGEFFRPPTRTMRGLGTKFSTMTNTGLARIASRMIGRGVLGSTMTGNGSKAGS